MTALRVGQREAQMEPSVGERKMRQPEAELPFAAAVPPQLGHVLRHRAEHQPAVVTQLHRDARGGDPRIRCDDEPYRCRFAGGELNTLVTFIIEQLSRHDARLTAAPLLQAGLELVGIRVRRQQPAVGGDRLARLAVECDLALP